MSITDISAAFLLGLLGSLHCVSMCGPIVVSLSVAAPAANRIALHLTYNAGRILTYTALGAAAGLAGMALDISGRLAGIEHAAMIVAGAVMVIAGLLLLNILPIGFLRRFDPLGLLSRVFGPIGRRIHAPGLASKFGLGLLLGFLPCGLIYAALLKSVSTGSVWAGAATMLFFGAGTAGALLGLGLFSSAFTRRLGAWGPRLAAVAVIAIGVILVYRGALPMPHSAAGTGHPHHG